MNFVDQFFIPREKRFYEEFEKENLANLSRSRHPLAERSKEESVKSRPGADILGNPSSKSEEFQKSLAPVRSEIQKVFAEVDRDTALYEKEKSYQVSNEFLLFLMQRKLRNGFKPSRHAWPCHNVVCNLKASFYVQKWKNTK